MPIIVRHLLVLPKIISKHNLYPSPFLATALTDHIEGGRGDAIDDHAKILAKIGKERTELDVLRGFEKSWGYEHWAIYEPERFATITRWLLRTND